MRPLQRIIRSAAIVAIPVLSLCLFATLTIYAGNSNEFSVSFVELLRVYLPYLIGVIAVGGVLGAFMTATGLQRYWSVLAALGVLFWLQGNILVWDYGVLDGREIEWLEGAWRGALDLGIWMLLIFAALTMYERFGKSLVFAAIAALGIQTVSAVSLLAGEAGPSIDRSSPSADPEILDAILEFSSNRNVVHIIMDGFQSDIFAGIVDDPQHAELAQQLKGFTLFRDNLGVYPYTQLTIPALMSGELYRNQVPVETFIRGTLQGDTILSVAYDAGFEVDIAAPVALANAYGQAQHSHAYGISTGDHVTVADYAVSDSAKLIDLALFRVVPHFAKALVYRDELWVFQSRVRAEAYLHMQYFSDIAFLQRLADGMSVAREAPVYKMIHVMLSHRPTVGNERCEYDGRHPASREFVTAQASCGLRRVLAVLERMQALGIYDDSLIVLMADHGAWVPVEEFQDVPGGESGVDALMVAMATPVLAIKPPQATAAMQVSRAQTSIVDVPATIADILGIDSPFPGTAAFAIEPGVERTRTYMTYGYGINPRSEEYLLPMQEFEVRGSTQDAGAWQRGKRYLPKGVEHHE